MKKIMLGAVAMAVMTVGIGAASSEAAFGPGISKPGVTATPSSTNPGPCITMPSGRLYCGN